MALGLKVQLTNKDAVQTEYLNFIKTLSNEKINLALNIDNAQIQEITKDIKKISSVIGEIDFGKFKQGLDDGVNKPLEETDKKIRNVQQKLGSAFSNNNIDKRTFEDLNKYYENIKQNVDKMANIKIVRDDKDEIKNAYITYKDSVGAVVKETLGWKSSQKTVNDEIVKTKTFTTLTTEYSQNLEKINNKLKETKANVDKVKKGKLFDENSFVEAENAINKIKEKYQKIGTVSISSNKNPITKEVEGLNINLQKTDGLVEKIKYNLVTLDGKKGFAITNLQSIDKTAELYEKVAQKEQQIRNTLSKNDAKETMQLQKSLYSDLNSLQTEEFSIKQKLIGQEGIIKQELEDQLSIVKQQQSETAKLITNNKLQDKNGSNQYLVERKSLMSDLNIKQEQYNSKEAQNTKEIQRQIELYRQQANIKIQNLQNRYGSLTENGDISKQIQDYKNALNGLNTNNFDSKKLTNDFKQIEANIKSTSGAIKNTQKDVLSFGDSVKLAAQKFTLWLSIGTVIMQSWKELKHGVDVIHTLDDGLTNINITMNGTKGKFDEMGKAAMDYSLALKTSLNNTLSAMQIYSNLNATMDDILKKSRASLILSDLTGKPIQNSANALQGMVYQFDLSSDSAEHLSDVMVKLASNTGVEFAESVENMTSSVARGGSVWAAAKGDIESYLSIVSTLNESSRLSGDTISTGLVQILSRITRVTELGEEEVSKLEKQFKGLGISIRDSATGEFYDAMTILKNINNTWKTSLDGTEKSLVAFLSSGTRQSKIFYQLMKDFDKINERISMAKNSDNFADERHDIWAESITAKLQNLRNVADSTWVSLMNRDSFKTFLDDATTLASGLGNVVKKLGLFPATFTSVIGVLMLANKNFREMSVNLVPNVIKKINSLSSSSSELGATFSLLPQKIKITNTETGVASTKFMLMGTVIDVATVKAIAFKAVMGTVSLGLSIVAGIVIGKVLVAFDNWIHRTERLKKANEELFAQTKDTAKQYSEVTELLSKYSTLQKQANDTSDTEKSAKAKSELLEVQKHIASILPNTTTAFTKEGEAISSNTELVREQLELKRQEMVLNAQKFMDENKGMDDLSAKYSQAKKDVEDLKIAQSQGKTTLSQEVKYKDEGGSEHTVIVETNIAKALAEKNKFMQESIDKISKYNIYAEVLNKYGNENIQTINLETKALSKNTQEKDANADTMETQAKSAEQLKTQLEELTKSYQDATGKLETYNKFLKEIDDNNSLSANSTNEIISKHKELAPYLGNTKELYKQIQKEIGNQEKVAKTTYDNMMLMDDTFNKEVYKNTAWLSDMKNSWYGTDLRNYANLGQGKLEIEQKIIQQVAGMWASFYNSQGNLMAGVFAQEEGIVDDGVYIQSKSNTNKVNKAFGIQSDIANKFKQLASDFDKVIPKVDFKGMSGDYYNGTNKPSSSGGSKSSSEPKTSTSDGFKPNNPVDQMLQRHTTELESQNKIIEKINSNMEEFEKLGTTDGISKATLENAKAFQQLNKEISLTKSQKSDLDKSLSNTDNALSKKLGKDVTGMTEAQINKLMTSKFPSKTFTGEKSSEQQNAYNKQISDTQELVQNHVKLSKAIEENREKEIEYGKELENNQLKTQQLRNERWEMIWSERDLEKKSIQDNMKLVEEADITEEERLIFKIGLNKDLIDAEKITQQGYKDAIKSMTEQNTKLDKNGQQWAYNNTQIASYNEKLNESNSQMSSLNATSRQMVEAQVRALILKQKEIDEAKLEIEIKKKLKAIEENTYKVSEADWTKYHNKIEKDVKSEITQIKQKLKYDKDNIYLKDGLLAKEQELATLQSESYNAITNWQQVSENIAKARIQAIDDEIKAIDERNNAEKISEERQKRQTELSDLQTKLNNLKILQAKELELYQGKSKEDFEESIKLQNEELQKQIDAIGKANEVEDEKEERLKRETDLLKLQNDLAETQKEENLKQLQKNADGKLEFVFIADPKKIEELNQQIEDKQKDNADWEKDLAEKKQIELLKSQIDANNKLLEENAKTLAELEKQLDNKATGILGQIDDLNRQILEKQKDNNDWELSLVDAKNRAKLENEKQYEQNLIDSKKTSYDTQKAELDTYQEAEKKDIETHYADVDLLVKTGMDGLKKTYGDKWDEMLVVIESKLGDAQDKFKKLQGILAGIEVTNSQISSVSNSSSGNSYNDKGFRDDPEYKRIENEFLKTHANGDVDSYDRLQAEAEKLKNKYKISGAKTGAYIDSSGNGIDGEGGKLLAVHPSKLILNKIDTKTLLSIQDLQKNLVTTVPRINNIPQINNTNKSNSIIKQYTFTGDLSFPNMTKGSDISDFMDQLDNIKNFKG